MKIPNKIKIGGHTFKVFMEKSSRVDDGGNCGRSERSKGEIYIASDLMQSQREVTFFHEVIHLLNAELEEESCDWLAEALYAFLKGNRLLK